YYQLNYHTTDVQQLVPREVTPKVVYRVGKANHAQENEEPPSPVLTAKDKPDGGSLQQQLDGPHGIKMTARRSHSDELVRQSVNECFSQRDGRDGDRKGAR